MWSWIIIRCFGCTSAVLIVFNIVSPCDQSLAVWTLRLVCLIITSYWLIVLWDRSYGVCCMRSSRIIVISNGSSGNFARISLKAHKVTAFPMGFLWGVSFSCLALATCVVSVKFVFGSSFIYKKRRTFSRVPEKKSVYEIICYPWADTLS
jgi:hypothetical protein